MKRILFGGLVAMLAGSGFATVPVATVTGVDHDVETGLTVVDYSLANGPAIVTLDVLKNGVSIGRKAIASAAGDVNELVSGTTGRIYWQPRSVAGIGDAKAGELEFRVKAWRKGAPPAYMVVDLRNRNTRYYYESEDDLPYGIGSPRYRVNLIALRKIPAAGATFSMGAPNMPLEPGRGDYEQLHRVSFTNDYYMGVFELTHGQFRMYAGYFAKPDGYGPIDRLDPLEYESYEESMRGARNSGYKWPQAGHAVDGNSWLGKVRTLTGVYVDLPTEAQWEFAARAGSTTALPLGLNQEPDLTLTGNVCTNTDKFAWYGSNSGGTTHHVGLRQPNAWGLYDVLGNVREACLDVWGDPCDSAEVEPAGVRTEERTQYAARGGCFSDDAHTTRLASRWQEYYSTSHDTTRGIRLGYRLWCAVPND